jgi:hypothetical protein
MNAPLRDRIANACYQHIYAHWNRYEATPYLVDCLPLMEPVLFADFASQAVIDVAALIGGRQDATLRNRLMECLSDFAEALDCYAPELERFKLVVHHANYAAMDNGINVGTMAGQLVGNLFGNVARAAVMFTGALFGGVAVGKQVDAEGYRLQGAFRQMLLAYDRAMEALTETACGLLDS